MKLSVSLPDEDVAFIDEFARQHGTNRSAALHSAVIELRDRNLSEDYAAAYQELDPEDAALWDSTAGDGIA